MKRLILISLLLLAGCSERIEVSDQPISELHERSISCDYAGYCFGYTLGFDGKMSFGFGFSASCSGSRDALVVTREKRYYWENKPTEIRSYRYDQVMNYLSNCR